MLGFLNQEYFHTEVRPAGWKFQDFKLFGLLAWVITPCWTLAGSTTGQWQCERRYPGNIFSTNPGAYSRTICEERAFCSQISAYRSALGRFLRS